MDEPRAVDEIRELSRQPLYRVRAGLRELGEAGLVEAVGDRWVITDAGRSALARPAGGSS
jgi:predicted transcriptional regulator